MDRQPTSSNGRSGRGRFTTGNVFGRLTRFKLGRSGNPRGRPPNPNTWLRLFNELGYGTADLTRILNNPNARSTERTAARWGIAYLARDVPIPVADPDRAHRLYRRWYKKTFDALFAIYFNTNEPPERREAARRRLRRWWPD